MLRATHGHTAPPPQRKGRNFVGEEEEEGVDFFFQCCLIESVVRLLFRERAAQGIK